MEAAHAFEKRRDLVPAERIRGCVARIFSSRELVINRGSAHGVTKGMIFDVLDPDAVDIRDPGTHDVLGSVYRPKVRVRVSVVKEKLCVAETFKTRRLRTGGLGSPDLSRRHKPAGWVYRVETLRAADAAWEDLSEEDSYVKTGDPVIQIVEGDELTNLADRPPEQRADPARPSGRTVRSDAGIEAFGSRSR
jgi:hypothetical protein